MKKKYQNGFLIFGLVVLAIMVSQLDFKEVWDGIQRAGYWFLAVVLLWAVLYIFNTSAWWIIIKAPTNLPQPGEASTAATSPQSGEESGAPTAPQQGEVSAAATSPQSGGERGVSFSFLWLYKITVSGFALNYATPGGLMGGEPYRIMSLSPYIGTERATSSVLLYVMTHIFSHFWFWLLSCVLYVITQPMDWAMGILLTVIAAFCLTAIWFFLKGYKKGIAVSGMRILSHIPFLKRWAKRFFETHAEQLATIDKQIAALHGQNPKTFFAAVFLELSCRVVSALEIFFILLVIMPSANYLQCILILAFTSLFANMLFFIPLQLGGREGGFLLSAKGLAIGAREGIFVALLVRLREIIWTAIGLLLIKIDKKAPQSSPEGDTKAAPRGGMEGANPSGAVEGATLILLFSICCTSCQALHRGDLLFHLPESSNHITEVTSHFSPLTVQGDLQSPPDHVAIFLGGDSVLEAIPEKGVVVSKLSDIMQREPGQYVVGKAKKANAERSIANARRFIGRPYDSIYSSTTEAIYCSELVQQSYVDKQGKLLFAPIAMSFHDNSGHITKYWQDFYGSRGLAVPEGQPGSNPSDLMKKVKIKKHKR